MAKKQLNEFVGILVAMTRYTSMGYRILLWHQSARIDNGSFSYLCIDPQLWLITIYQKVSYVVKIRASLSKIAITLVQRTCLNQYKRRTFAFVTKCVVIDFRVHLRHLCRWFEDEKTNNCYKVNYINMVWQFMLLC